MAEYIERDAVFKIVVDMMCDCKVRHKGRAINRNIKQLPTADVVPVVRCCKCTHSGRLQDVDKKIPVIFRFCLISGSFVADDHYCGYGERSNKND